ncbi:MAG: septum formation protein Maf, partial [Chloroflexi bacterium]|nr:septum formation protein Maf [Chloroflexota bacterium]
MLASASPRRRELLPALRVTFEVIPADVDESDTDDDAARLARDLAVRKARAIAADRPADTVIGADTIVVLDGRQLGKPADADEARAMLEALRGRTHHVVTGVAVIANGAEATEAVTTAVTMRDYSDDEVTRYVARGEPFDKAGAYAVQDPEFAPAAAVEGCRCAVIGLPLWTLRRLLLGAGVEAGPPELPDCLGCPHRED